MASYHRMRFIFKWLAILLFALAVLTALFLILFPALRHASNVMRLHMLDENVCTVNEYYSVLYNALGTLLLLIGVILGYAYYSRRRRYDQDCRIQDIRHEHIDRLLNALTDYEEAIEALLSRTQPDSDIDLRKKRRRIERCMDRINTMIEHTGDLLGIMQADLKDVSELFSYVDNSETISHMKYTDFIDSDYKDVQVNVDDLVNVVRSKIYTLYALYDVSGYVHRA